MYLRQSNNFVTIYLVLKGAVKMKVYLADLVENHYKVKDVIILLSFDENNAS